MFRSDSKLNRIFVALCVFGIVMFVSMSFLTLIHASTMNMDGDMSASRCPFVSGMAICDTGPFAHISAWHSVFSTLIVRDLVAMLFIVTLYAVIALRLFTDLDPPPKSLGRLSRVFYSGYMPLTSLQEAFSAGIINPKVF